MSRAARSGTLSLEATLFALQILLRVGLDDGRAWSLSLTRSDSTTELRMGWKGDLKKASDIEQAHGHKQAMANPASRGNDTVFLR